ncbi:MAG: universal stress protein [Rhodospirillaceae bacterium]
MAPRLILVPVSGVESDWLALETALGVARGLGAHLEVLFLTPDPRDSVLVLGDGLSTLMVEEIMSATESVWQQRAIAARRSFDALVSAAGLKVVADPAEAGGVTIRWRERVGRADEEIIAEGQLADLMVFGQVPGHHELRETQVLESALLYTGRPVLLTSQPQPTVGRRVAIAWNGKLEASRAVAAAHPFLATAERVSILTLRAGGETAGHEGARLADYLAWHGIGASVETIAPEPGPPYAALVRRAVALETDLLVMGAYGHSRVRELILGGATRHILTHGGPAVLLAH